MSQKTARKGVIPEEKEKRQTDSPVKDMKKKMAANAEKEKQVAEKTVEKPTEKADKPAEKTDKPADKKTDKPADKKTEKPTEKKTDKSEKKPEAAPEKKEESSKDDKAGKSDKPEAKPAKPKQNGSARVNGANGDHNGTVSPSSDDDDDAADEADEMFPELTYDDTSDPEFEPDAPHGRSLTRRSQAKATRTPETPRPASERPPEGADDSKDSKVLKLKEDVPSTDRKLRSADSPKPEPKKQETKPETAKKPEEKPQEPAKKTQESPLKQESAKKDLQEKESPKKPEKETKDKEREEKENGESKMEVEIVVEIEDEEEPRKTDTNFSKSRVKVSPYRRSMRADQTASSTMANYTGNNTTMEMDITESSFISTEASLDDSSYLSGLRTIRGRRSYKPLKEMTLRHVTERSRANTSAPAGDQPTRPTGTVVGRKRKPETDESIELATDAAELVHGKRVRLLDRLAHTFRRTASTPLPARRNAEIVGINTDLPLTAPVAASDTFDPETLKPSPTPDIPPAAVPLAPADTDKDSKRCVIM